jgi:hypothetical protein
MLYQTREARGTSRSGLGGFERVEDAIGQELAPKAPGVTFHPSWTTARTA